MNRKWERTYQPEWKSISLLEWATNHNHDNNHYVKKLANKTQIDTATETDLEYAKHTIKSYFIVGLTNQMKESTRRFNVILGIDDVHDKRHAKCMKDFFPLDTSSTRLNSNIHPEVSMMMCRSSVLTNSIDNHAQAHTHTPYILIHTLHLCTLKSLFHL